MSRTFLPRLLVGIFLLVLISSTVVTVRAVLAARAPTGDPAAPPSRSLRPTVTEAALLADRDATRAATLLRRWDARRAQAWADADPERLAGLYVPGSEAGRSDVAMLAAYRGRGLVVHGLDTQLLAVEVLGRSPDRWRLRVTDRVVGGEVVDRAGVRRALPRDAASTRVVTLLRRAGTWRVAEVVAAGAAAAQEPAASAASTTAPTVRSRNR